MALNPPSGIVQWYNSPLGERGWNAFRAHLTGKNYPGTSRKTSYVKLSDKEADEVISNIKKDSEGIPLFDEANAPGKAEEYQRWLVARYLTESREKGFESRKKEGTKQLEEELGPDGLDELLNLIREESAVEVGAGVGGGGGSSAGTPPPSSSALAVVPKKPDDLVEEDIDSQILSILGLEDVFDLTYEEYASLLKEAAVKGRMPNSQMTTGSVELVTEEFKRVKGKTGKFKVKQKKVDINKVLNRKQPTPSGAIVKAQKLIPPEAEVSPDQESKVSTENLQEDLINGIGDILQSLIAVKYILQGQSKVEEKSAKEDLKESKKEEKKEREKKLEKKKPVSPILKSLKKPVDDFFGAIKRFFTNILLGSVVLGMFNWLKDPANQGAIDNFTNFLENNAGLILGGLLAIASLPLLGPLLSLTGAITGIAIPAIKAAFAFLASPAGLLALGTAAGVGLGLAAVKGVEVVAKNLIYGGGSFTEAHESLNRKLFAAGMDIDGIPQVRRQNRNFKSGKPRTAEQEKIFKEVESERNRIDKLREEHDAELKKMEEENNKIINKIRQENTVTSGRGTKISGEGKKELQEQNQKFKSSKKSIEEKYTALINKDQSVSKPQPQTPLMPGLPPSAAQPGTGPAGNQVGSSSASSSLSRAASDLRGMSSAAGPDGGKNGCVWAVNKVFARAGIKTPWGSSEYVPTAEQEMINAGYQSVSSPAPGDIYVAPGQRHLGIVLDNGNIISNSSSGAKFSWEASPASYASYYGGSGKYYRIPPSVVATGQPSVGRAAQVERSRPSTPSIPSPSGRSNIVPLSIASGGRQSGQSNSAPLQSSVPRFSSEDPNNMTTMVVKSIYNVVG